MRTTIDLPEDMLQRAKRVAAQRHTTFKELVMSGLDRVMGATDDAPENFAAIERLHKGLSLGGRPMTREQTHERS
jgi:hypothetical protein